jgi:hypothetical protein
MFCAPHIVLLDMYGAASIERWSLLVLLCGAVPLYARHTAVWFVFSVAGLWQLC